MMKSAGVLVLVVMAVLASCVLFALKTEQQLLPLDEMRTTLGGLRKILHENNTIGSANYSQEADQIVNAMAPISVISGNHSMDTLLFMFGPKENDSTINSLIAGRQVVWRAVSDRFLFLLTVKSKGG
jgi:hypothetical protein